MKSFMPFVAILAALFAGAATTVRAASADDDKSVVTVPADFTGDGCTGFPEGNYTDCCFAHDKEYYVGGSWKERWRSDMKLYRCVAAKPKFYNKIVAPMMWLGVRVMGVPWLRQKYSWGFGRREQERKKKRGK